jgi:TolB-like protein
MNAGTPEEASTNGIVSETFTPSNIHDLRISNDESVHGAGSRSVFGGLFLLIAELRRRKVCRAITSYCLGLWLICQVVDIVSPQIGLPDWTLRFVIVIGLCGFPVAVVLSWLFDVTPRGLVLDHYARSMEEESGKRKRRTGQLIDIALLVAALAIGAQLLFASSVGEFEHGAPIARVAVLPFAYSSDQESTALRESLHVELQHELGRRPEIRVIAPKHPDDSRDGSNLRGAIVVRADQIRVTALLVNNRTGELTWSAMFRIPLGDPHETPGEIARRIVEAPDFPFRSGS